MPKVAILSGGSLPNMPWQDRGDDRHDALVWRYRHNPIIGRNPAPGVARIFNSAVAPFGDGFKAVLRGEQVDGVPHIYLGSSRDGIHWDIGGEKIALVNEKGGAFMPRYAYDPRLVKVEDDYYIIWCTDFFGASIGMAKTRDFQTFVRMENPFIPYNRNAVLFPRKIGGGAAPIETSEGWLLFYHGVSGTCNGFVYSIGGVILDTGEPSRVKYRCRNFLLTPEEPYEERGFVPNVCFPCATLEDKDTGRIAIYYGAADTYVGLAFTLVDEVVEYIKEHSVLTAEDTEIGVR